MSSLHLSGSDLGLGLAVGACVLAVAAAVRSTWSPCGLSMLSSITPIGERGRGGRYRVTASWFSAGAVLGGVTLGVGTAGASLLVGVAGLGAPTRTALAAAAAFLAGAADLGLLGFRLPVLRRQVNERWLDRYRPWVYGAGFGWQIGTGFATYVMTAGVFACVAAAALTCSPWFAGAVGVGFGSVRGLAVWCGARIADPVSLQRAHRRFEAWRRPVWLGVVGVEGAVGVLLAALLWTPGLVVAAVVVPGAAVLLPRTALRRVAPPG